MPEQLRNYFYISPSGDIRSVDELNEILSLIKDDGYVWLDYCEPSKEDLLKLSEPFGLHPLSIEDCIDSEQLPKLENFPNYTFMIVNVFDHKENELRVVEYDAFIGSNFLITVSDCKDNSLSFLQQLKQQLDYKTNKLTQGPSYLLHSLLDKIVDQKFYILDKIEDLLDMQETQILSNLAGFKPDILLDLKRELMTIRKSLFHEREVIGKIIRQDSRFVQEKSLIYFRDIYDHLNIYYELAETSRDMETSLMEMYLSMLNNHMSRSANQTNAIMRRLTIITTIFMPLTLLSGIGGMSEFTMMTGQENWRIAYLALMAGMILIAFINFLLIRNLEKKSRNGAVE